MLEQLLAEIQKGGTFEVAALAARFGTTPGLVQAMLEHLQRSGHIQPYQTCGSPCSGCSLQKSCLHSAQTPRLWQG